MEFICFPKDDIRSVFQDIWRIS